MPSHGFLFRILRPSISLVDAHLPKCRSVFRTWFARCGVAARRLSAPSIASRLRILRGSSADLCPQFIQD